jgi:hypothetical protein
MTKKTIITTFAALTLGLVACSKGENKGETSAKGAEGGATAKAGAKLTCADVETAMRRIDPERTKDLKPGTFQKVCESKPAEFDQGRIDCIVEAEFSSDLEDCADPATRPIKPPPGATADLAWRDVPRFGAKLEVPGNVKILQHDSNAHLTNGTFKVNLFRVDEYSMKTAAEKKASLQKEPGFVKFTKEEPGEKTWHFEYELEGGKAGTTWRIDVGAPLDCGVHNQTPANAAAASKACASAKAL